MDQHGRPMEARLQNVWFAQQQALHAQLNTNFRQPSFQQLSSSVSQCHLGGNRNNSANPLLDMAPRRFAQNPEPEGLESWSQIHSRKHTRDGDDKSDNQPSSKRPSSGFCEEKVGSWSKSDSSSMGQMSIAQSSGTNSSSSWNNSNSDSRTAASMAATSLYTSTKDSKHNKSSTKDDHNAYDHFEEEEDLHVGPGGGNLLAPRRCGGEALQFIDNSFGHSEALLLAVMITRSGTPPTPTASICAAARDACSHLEATTKR
eukprot:648875-Rhodomonas_salina.3